MMQGPRTAAVKANLENMGKKVLLVEGIDDWHSFGHMIQTATRAFPAFELGYCGNDNGVLDVLQGVTLASRPSQTILGAVLDADRGEESDSVETGVQARIRSLQARLGGCYAIPPEMPAEGLILSPTTELDKDILPVLGIWLMPDNVRDGIFEDLLSASMAPASEKYISVVVDKAKDDGMTGFRAVERSKAIVKTHIAWQDPNKKNLGEAIGSHFENLAPACRPFMNWLERLFN
jgi:hypothetical protein